ncbi:hypothetical protein G6F56_013556 [Rhizopus delemar]|nr:hypothetical protein G6F56_013556 [Rhizopus delemar]
MAAQARRLPGQRRGRVELRGADGHAVAGGGGLKLGEGVAPVLDRRDQGGECQHRRVHRWVVSASVSHRLRP